MIHTVGVLGAGQMGNGIAHLFALHGHEVLLCDIHPAQRDHALATIRRNLERQAEKGTIPLSAVEETLARIGGTGDLADFRAVDFVVEAVTESEPVKKDLFQRLDALVPPAVCLATNTSSLSITRLASATRRPEKVIGMHFMNPVPLMPLVEIVRGHATSDETFHTVATLAASLGKETIVVHDSPGFVVNRILIPMINEAIFALQEGIATAEDIDKGMTLGTHHPMGPLALADFIGLDTVLSVANVLYDGFKDSKYRPCPLLVRMVDAGTLGRKTGRGFFDYGEEKR